MNIVFMGTPGFAREILRQLFEFEQGKVIAVYTQPDRPCGRGQVCQPSEVKLLALEHDVEILQPENFKDEADVQQLRDLNPDVIVVAAYGLILPQSVLDIPRLGCINVHASLLPKYRGAAPIHRAIINGDALTGITIMQMEAGLDSGPIMMQRAFGIDINDTTEILHDQLAEMGGRMMVETLERIPEGRILSYEQDHDRATYAKKLTKAEGEINWSLTAREVHNRVRGLHPWPGSYFFVTHEETGKRTRVICKPGKIGEPIPEGTVPGTILPEQDGHIAIACADNTYLIPNVRPAGKKEMDARSFYCGYMNVCCDVC